MSIKFKDLDTAAFNLELARVKTLIREAEKKTGENLLDLLLRLNDCNSSKDWNELKRIKSQVEQKLR